MNLIHRFISWFCKYDEAAIMNVRSMVELHTQELAAVKTKATKAMIELHTQELATAKAKAVKAQQLLLDLGIESKLSSSSSEVVITWTETGKAASHAWPIWPRAARS